MRIILLCLLLSGCSLVQWLPTSNCQKVEYIRIDTHVSVKAECEV